MTEFLIGYNVAGASYTARVCAATWDDAERHLLAIAATGRVLGKFVQEVPATGIPESRMQREFWASIKRHYGDNDL